MKNGSICPGTQAITVISAMPNGLAAQILCEIAHPDHNRNPQRNRREFGSWEERVCTGMVHAQNGKTFRLTLKIGVREGLFLRDVLSTKCSMKNLNGTTELALGVGSCIVTSDIAIDNVKERIRRIANNIVGCWVIHGEMWIDRANETIRFPYGRRGSKCRIPSRTYPYLGGELKPMRWHGPEAHPVDFKE